MIGQENPVTDDMVSEHIELINLYERLSYKQKSVIIDMMKLIFEKEE